MKTSFPDYAGFLQLDIIKGDCRSNINKVQSMLAELCPLKGGLVVLPEMWALGFDYLRLGDHARMKNELLIFLQQEAAKHTIWLAGSITESESEDGSGPYYNTLYLVGPETIEGSYRKQQLCVPRHEDRYFSPGLAPKPIAVGDGLVACLLCFDLYFPELVRAQAGRGAQLLIVSAQWPTNLTNQWRTLVQARAIENQLFVVACNRATSTDDPCCGGRSMIVGPDGAILAEAGKEETAIGIALNLKPTLDKVKATRLLTVARTPYSFCDQDKIKTLAELKQEVGRCQKMGKRMVFTNGCFDLLHQGHVSYLEAARCQGDMLIVGLNSDHSVRSIKGPDRPVNDQDSRIRVLAALGCVDYVVLFDDDTPLSLITSLLPDILVKGADWPIEKIIGGAEVLANGGRVINIPLIESFSTTGLIERIKRNG